MSPAITLITCDNITSQSGQQFNYDTDISGTDLLSEVCRNLQIPEAKSLRLLLRLNNQQLAWISPTETLSQLQAASGMTLYILKTNTPVSVTTPDGSTKKMIIDITKTVDELIQFIADKQRISNDPGNISNSLGYSLFLIGDKGVHIPLNPNLSLPQQTQKFDNLYFKRIFFVFTKSQMKDPASALMTFHDVKFNIEKRWPIFNIDPEVYSQLIYYQLYSLVNTPIEPINVGDIPQNLAPNIKAQLDSLLSSKIPPQTRLEAINHYLSIASELNGFGCNCYKVQYSLNNAPEKFNSHLLVGPHRIELVNLQNNQQATSLVALPFTRYVSSSIDKEKVDIHGMAEEGNELVIKIIAASPNEAALIKTDIDGYSHLLHEYSSELLFTGSNSIESGPSKTSSAANINISSFSKYYTYDSEKNGYIYYPGLLSEYQNIFIPHLDKVQQFYPNLFHQINKHLAVLAKDPTNQDAILHLIYATESLQQPFKGQPSPIFQYIDNQSFNKGILTLSTQNITVDSLEELLEDVKSAITAHKIIRNDIFVRVDITWKQQINTMLETMKSYRQSLTDLISKLKECPTDGTVLFEAQNKLLDIFFTLPVITQNAQSLVQYSQGTSYLPILDLFRKHLRDTLRPIIPREPEDRLTHVIRLHQLLFTISVVLSIGYEMKKDQAVIDNSEMTQKLTEMLTTLSNSYSKANQTKKKLLLRPLSLVFIDQIKNDLNDLQRDLISLIDTSALIESLTGNGDLFLSVELGNDLTERLLTFLNEMRIEQYRDIPLKDQVKSLHESITQTIQSINSSKATEERSTELLKKVKEILPVLNSVASNLAPLVNNPNRSIFRVILVLQASLSKTLPTVRQFCSVIQNASLLQSFMNLSQLIEDSLVPGVPSYPSYHQCVKEMFPAVQSISNVFNNNQQVKGAIQYLLNSKQIERDVNTLQFIKNAIGPLLHAKCDPQTIAALRNAFDAINSVIVCINQLPLNETSLPPTLNIIPFFKGKEINQMIDEVASQSTLVSNSLQVFKTNRFVGANPRIQPIVDYWIAYFQQSTALFPQIKANQLQLLSKLREMLKTDKSLKLFLFAVASFYPQLDDFTRNLDCFFSNVTMLIQAFTKPIIDDPQSFVLETVPQIANLTRMFQVANPVNNIQLLQKMKQLDLLTSINNKTMKASELQQMVDTLYPILQDMIQFEKESPTPLNPTLSAYLMDLELNLREVTGQPLSTTLKDKNYRCTIPSKSISALADEIINQISVNLNVQRQITQQLEQVFNQFTVDIESLPSSISSAAAFIKSQGVQNYPFDAIRLLIRGESNRQSRLSHLKTMAIMFMLAVAQLSQILRPLVEQIQTQSTNPKIQYYAAKLIKSIDEFSPQTISETKSFQSVSFAYPSNKDIQVYISLLLSEGASNDQNFNNAAYFLLNALDQVDVTMALYFSASIENLLKQYLCYQKALRDSTKIAEVMKQIDFIEDPSLIFLVNFIKLSSLSQFLIDIENEINTLSQTNKNDPFIESLLTKFKQMKEFKVIIHQWISPINEFELESFKLVATSDLILSQAPLSSVNEQYSTDILKLPILFARPGLRLTSLHILSEYSKKDHNEIATSVQNTTTIVDSIMSQFNLLGSNSKNYKGDFAIQNLFPSFLENFNMLIPVVTGMKEPDYSKLPVNEKLNGIATPRQLDLVLAQTENTQMYTHTKSVINFLRDLRSKDVTNPEILNTYASLVNLLPSECDLPISEVVQRLLQSLSVFYQNESKSVNEVLPLFPPVLCPLVRFLSSLTEKANQRLNINSIEILQQVNEYSKNSPQALPFIHNKFVQLSIFLQLRETVQTADEIEQKSIQETINLINSLEAKNNQDVLTSVKNLIAYQVIAADKNLDLALLDEIDPVLKEIDTQKLDGQHDKLLKCLAQDSIKFAKLANSIDVIDSLIDLSNDTVNDDSILNLINLSGSIQLKTYRGIQLTPNLNSSQLYEYIDDSFLSMFSLKAYIENNSKSSLRMFRRYNDNTSDLIDDYSLDADTFDEPLGFEQTKAKFVLSCSSILSIFSLLNLSFANTRLPSTFALVLAEQTAKINEFLNNLNTMGQKMTEINTNKELNSMFTKNLGDFKKLIESNLKTMAISTEKTIISTEFPLVESLHDLSSLANQMTDEVPICYEPDQANRLPQKFVLPVIDQVSNSVKLQEAANDALKDISNLNVSEYADSIASLQTNKQIVDATLLFYEKVNSILRKSLLVSIQSVNLQNKLDITSNCNTFCDLINMLNKIIKNKCLGSLTWLKDSQRILKEVNEKANDFNGLLNEAIQFADNEDTQKVALREKIFNVLNPLQQRITDIENISEIVTNDEPINPNREFSLSLLQFTNKSANALSNILLYAKDQSKEDASLDDNLVKADQLSGLMNSFVEKVHYDRNDQKPQIEIPKTEELIQFNQKLSQIVGAVQLQLGQKEESTGKQDEITSQMKEQIGMLSKGIDALGSAMAQAVDTQTGKKSQFNSPEAQTRLMTRLDLESKVIMFRYKVEFLDEQLKKYA